MNTSQDEIKTVLVSGLWKKGTLQMRDIKRHPQRPVARIPGLTLRALSEQVHRSSREVRNTEVLPHQHLNAGGMSPRVRSTVFGVSWVR